LLGKKMKGKKGLRTSEVIDFWVDAFVLGGIVEFRATILLGQMLLRQGKNAQF